MFVGGQWTLEDSKLLINLLQLDAKNLALSIFHKIFCLKAVHFQVDNTTALSYLIRMDGEISKEINVMAMYI